MRGLKIVTINVPESYVSTMDGLVGEDGLYPSRSELIRVAVREFLIKELKMAKEMLKYTYKENLPEIDETKYVRVPKTRKSKKAENDKEKSSYLLDTLKIFKNPYYDDIMRMLIGNRTWITPFRVSKDLGIDKSRAKEQLDCLVEKFDFVKEKNGSYKINLYFLQEYLRGKSYREKALKTLKRYLKRVPESQKKEQHKEDIESDKYVHVPITDKSNGPVREFKTYKIIRRLEY